MSQKFLSGLAGMIIGVFALAATAQAQPVDACISIAGKFLRPAEVYDDRHLCGTCPGQRDNPKLCGAINRLMVPYWEKPADLVAIPHRGIWGQPLSEGASENTLAAFKQALAAGYRIIEIDAAFTGSTAKEPRTVFLGHYFSMLSVNGDTSKKPSNYSPSEITRFAMNKRDTSTGSGPDNNLALIKTVITWAKEQQVLLMVDPKIPEGADPADNERIIAKILDEALEQQALSNIAIKTTTSINDTMERLRRFGFLTHEFNNYQGKFLWSPIINKSVTTDKYIALSSIEAWHRGTRNSKQVVVYEVGVYYPEHWTAKNIYYFGQNWDNLIHLAKGLGKRSSIWSIDPMSDKGTLGRLYNWKFDGNTPTDRRGNPLVNLSYAWARHVAVNTDRPDIYNDLVTDPYAGSK